MKKILTLIAFACISDLLLAQDYQQQKTDSVCRLIKKYFNEKKSEKLYELTGEAFKKALSSDAFKAVCDQNLFPLAEFKETLFENNSDGVSKYKAVFSLRNSEIHLAGFADRSTAPVDTDALLYLGNFPKTFSSVI